MKRYYSNEIKNRGWVETVDGMDSVSAILQKRPYVPLVTSPEAPGKKKRTGIPNPLYDKAVQISERFGVGVGVGMAFKLLKSYTLDEIMSLSGWWADYPSKTKKIGLLVFKLKLTYQGKGDSNAKA